MTFSAATLPPLAMQLSDIRDLCGTLFQAKVNALAWLKRAPIDVQDSPGSPDYLSSRPITNKVTIAMPYELAFHGFSSDLAAVLEGLARLPQCFVVSGLTVEPLQDPAVAGTSVPALAETRLLPPAHDALPVDRYRQQRPNRPVYVHPTAATVLDQKPLRFVLSVQAVRLRSEARAGLSAVGSDR